MGKEKPMSSDRAIFIDAIYQGNYGNVKQMLLRFEDIANISQGYLQISPLHITAINDRVDIMHLLIREGANVDARSITGETPLHMATKHGYVTNMAILLGNRADIDAQDNKDRTALHISAMQTSLDTMELLLKWKADPFIIARGQYALDIAKHYENENAIKTLDTYIQNYEPEDRGATSPKSKSNGGWAVACADKEGALQIE